MILRRSNSKKKALLLHGFRLSGDVFQQQAQELVRHLPGEWNCTFLSGTHEAAGPSHPDVVKRYPSLEGGAFEWWNAQTEETPDEDGCVSYKGIEATLDRLVEVHKKEGPFDVIFGFSQGSMVATLLTALCEKPDLHKGRWHIPSHLRWRAIVHIAGGCPRGRGFGPSLLPLPLVTPSIHVIGDRDFALPESTRLLEDWYCQGTRRVVKHDGGHNTPKDAPSLRAISRHLGERLDKTVWCFDFDGVLCDSAAECAHTGWRGAQRLGLIDRALGEVPPASVVQAFCRARPVLETGFEAIIIVYMLVVETLDAETILRDWSTLFRDACMSRMSKSEAVLKDAHHTSREEWISKDADGWIAAHGTFEPSVQFARSLVARKEVVYVITTKSAVFANRLIADMKLEIPPNRVFGLGSGPKRSVMEEIATQHEDARGSFFFLEDRLATLRDVASKGRLPCRLALADWGYNTSQERAEAKREGFMVLSLDDLQASNL